MSSSKYAGRHQCGDLWEDNYGPDQGCQLSPFVCIVSSCLWDSFKEVFTPMRAFAVINHCPTGQPHPCWRSQSQCPERGLQIVTFDQFGSNCTGLWKFWVLSPQTTNFMEAKIQLLHMKFVFFFGGKFQEQAYNIMGYQLCAWSRTVKKPPFFSKCMCPPQTNLSVQSVNRNYFTVPTSKLTSTVVIPSQRLHWTSPLMLVIPRCKIHSRL
jgi:hypothetical protein